MKLNITDLILEMTPGESRKLPLLVTVPANYTAKGIFDVETPLNETAVMTITSVRLISAGKNLACMDKRTDEEYKATLNSTQGTSQMDKLYLDLGIVSNTGLFFWFVFTMCLKQPN